MVQGLACRPKRNGLLEIGRVIGRVVDLLKIPVSRSRPPPGGNRLVH
jgi:hypothetical protein